LILFIWIGVKIVDPGALPDGNTVWSELGVKINSALNTFGLSLKLWYVIVALVITYLAVFQWARAFVANLPILRLRYARKYDPNLLAHACETLQLRPEVWVVSEALYNLVEKYDNNMRESGRPHPYQWLFDREQLWNRYYGTLIVVLFAVIAWAIEGGTYSRGVGEVWWLVFLLIFIGVFVRWRTEYMYAYGQQQLAFWALREYERERGEREYDPVRGERYRTIEKEAKFNKNVERSPAYFIYSLSHRLPERVGRWVRDRVNLPYWSLAIDWDILASNGMRLVDETYVPPSALSIKEYLPQFSGLLECTGAGLCIVVPQSCGLAPSLRSGGSRYSFASRNHDGHLLAFRLYGNSDVSNYELVTSSSAEYRSMLIEVGPHPIELLAQRSFPNDKHIISWLLYNDIKDETWASKDKIVKIQDEEIQLSENLPLKPGSSYLHWTKTQNGTRAIVAFQCFLIESSAKILVAWRILDVHFQHEDVPEVPAWWQVKAWKAVVQQLGTPSRKRRYQ